LLAAVALAASFGCAATGAPPAPTRSPSEQASTIAGDWDWFIGGVTTIRADGTFVFSDGTRHGTWQLTDPSQRLFTLVWSSGFTDTLVLSADGRVLDGKNQVGTHVWGHRRILQN
jgi:hypothetical protein